MTRLASFYAPAIVRPAASIDKPSWQPESRRLPQPKNGVIMAAATMI
jgi:hypothetical protein